MRTMARNSLSSARTVTSRGVSPEFIASMPMTSNTSWPVSPSDSALWPGWNCSGSTPMPIRLDRWIRSNDSTSTARTPSSAVPLAAQSRDEPDPYSLPPSTISGVPAARYSREAS